MTPEKLAELEEAVRKKVRAMLAEWTEEQRQALRDRDPAAVEAAEQILRTRMTAQEHVWALEAGALETLEELPDDAPKH